MKLPARLNRRAAATPGDPALAAQTRDARDLEHLRLLLAFTLAPDSNCIDVGAHAGIVLRQFLHYAPDGSHIAYEPLPALHAELVSAFPGVDVRRAALSNRRGEAEFTHVPELPAYSGFRERTYPRAAETERFTVRVEDIDSSLPPGYVPTLIKIDVEGAELEVLEGGAGTIGAHRPIVFFEHGRGAAEHYATAPGAVHDLLRELGLRIFDIDGNGPLGRGEFEVSFERGAVWTYVAHAGITPRHARARP